MSFIDKKIPEIIKQQTGDNFPEDLVFVITKCEIKFYNKDIPLKNSVYVDEKSEVSDVLFSDLIRVISKYHITTQTSNRNN